MKKQSVLILLSACLCSAVLANSNSSASSSGGVTDKEALLFIKTVLYSGYSQVKLSAISDLIETLSEEAYFANLTLIGSQNVYNADGTLKEIRTIELAIPYQLWKEFPESDYDFDSEDFDKLRDAREFIKGQSFLGIDMDFNYVSRDKSGEVTEQIYMDKDKTAVVKMYEYNILNQTIEVENKKEAQDFISNVKPGAIINSLICFDKDGNFIENKSLINTDLHVIVTDEYDGPKLEFIEAAKLGLALAYLSSGPKEDIPKKLQAYLNKSLGNGTSFTVTLDNPSGQYIFKDYSVTLRYNLVDFADEPYYHVHGYRV